MSQQYDAALIDREYEHYFPLILDHRSSLANARKELETRGVEKHNIDFILKQLNRDLQRHAERQTRKKGAIGGFWGSAAILAIGLGVTIYTYMLGGSHWILAYGAIASGFMGMLASLVVYKSNKGSLK